MSIIIFFGFALFIFLLGATVVSVTFYHWYKLAKEAKHQKKLAESVQ
jgi:lipopolysaccharide export LptBFGC system permease protein LptF